MTSEKRATRYTSQCPTCQTKTETTREDKEAFIEHTCTSCGAVKNQITHAEAWARLKAALSEVEG